MNEGSPPQPLSTGKEVWCLASLMLNNQLKSRRMNGRESENMANASELIKVS